MNLPNLAVSFFLLNVFSFSLDAEANIWSCSAEGRAAGNYFTESFFDRDVTYRIIDQSAMVPAVDKKKGQWLYVEADRVVPNWTAETDIFVGLTDGGHAYVTGEGFLLEATQEFEGYVTKTSTWISPGVLLHLRGLPPARVEALREAILTHASGIGGLSCIHKVNSALACAGIRTAGGAIPVLPTDQMKGWVFNGFTLDDGTAIRSQIYVNERYSLDTMYRIIERREREQAGWIEQQARNLLASDPTRLSIYLRHVPPGTINYVRDEALRRQLEALMR